jgi:uncharacterized protein (TIGR02271 family)
MQAHIKERIMASTVQREIVVGVFDNREKAQEAVHELKRNGFRDDQVGVVSRDEERANLKRDGGDEGEEEGSRLAKGAAIGAASGAGIGGLWAVGIAFGLLPAIGPVIAGGILASLLASAGVGAAVGGVAGALIGLGVPEDKAEYYDGEFRSGRTIVTVKALGRTAEALAIMRRYGGYDMQSRRASATDRDVTETDVTDRVGATGASAVPGAGPRTVRAYEEERHPHKETTDAGEVRVYKEEHTEHRTIDVPVTKEEVVIERHPGSGQPVGTSNLGKDEEIRIPVQEEEVHVEKQPVVMEEVTVSKKKVQDTERVSDTVRKEEIHVEKEGDVDVRDERKDK